MSLNFYLVELFPSLISQIYAPAYGLEKMAIISEDFASDIDTLATLDSCVKNLTKNQPSCVASTKFNPFFFPSQMDIILARDEDEEDDDIFLSDHIQCVETRVDVVNSMTGEPAMTARICAHPAILDEMEGRSEFFVVH
jgi:hypothetical protein